MIADLIPAVIIAGSFAAFLLIGKTSKRASWEGGNRYRMSRFDGSTWLVVPFIATNLTITGGVVGSFAGAQYYGWCFLFAPVFAAVAAINFSYQYSRKFRLVEDRTFVIPEIAQKSWLFVTFTAAATLINVFLIGWELHIATQALSAYYSDWNFIANNRLLIMLLLAALVVIYLGRSSFDRSAVTDFPQMIGALLFIFIALAVHKAPDSFQVDLLRAPAAGIVEISLFVAATLFANFFFAFVNINYWQLAQSANEKSLGVFTYGALGLVVFSFLVYWLAVSADITNPFGLFMVAEGTTQGSKFAIALMVGLIPMFLWSTVDTSAVSVSHILSNVVTSWKIDASEGRGKLPLIILVGATGVAYLLSLTNPNIFQSLLAGTSSLLVFVPIIYRLYQHGALPSDQDQAVAKAAGILFVLTFVVAFTLALLRKGDYVFIPGIVGMVLSWWLLRRQAMQAVVASESSGENA